MTDALYEALGLILGNMSTSLLLLALLIGAFFAAKVKGTHKRRAVTECFLRPLLFFSLGCASLWNAYWHAVQPAEVARFIGWQPSPFQWEIAMTNLGLGLAGLIAWQASRGFRLATALFAAVFLWGAAAGHIWQLVYLQDTAPGNAGGIVYTDVLTPLLLVVLLAVQDGEKAESLA
ncbi:DUF6790 family protein [Desulfarculus baarsii]